MGNSYSYTSSIASQGPWWTNLIPMKWIAIAGSAVIQTTQLGAKVVVTPLTTLTANNQNVPNQTVESHGETATCIIVYATWLANGSYSGIGSTFSGTLTGQPLTHWFALIYTDNPNIYYWANFNISGVSLQRCYSVNEVKKKGCRSGGNQDAQNFTIKKSKTCYRSMSSVQSWVRNKSHHYNLTWHNCQIWAEDLYNWI